MLKKKMILAIAACLLITTTVIQTPSAETVHANAACSTLSECRERRQEAQENVERMLEEEEGLSEDILILQDEIGIMRADIDAAESEVAILEGRLAIELEEISILADEIRVNLDIYEETGANIEELLVEVSQRMRINQHTSNRNAFVVMISEAGSLVDLIRQTRTFRRLAEDDANSMEMLTELIAFQEEVLAQLEVQQTEAQTRRDEFETQRAHAASRQAHLTTLQEALVVQEHNLLMEIYELGLNRVSEEEFIASIEEAEEILRRTPPPPVITDTPPAANGMPQTPNASGLAHPLPGSVVTSGFGPRGGHWHGGIDLAVIGQPAAPILAAASGTVTLAEFHWSMGWWVIISHQINGQRVETVYAHLRYQPIVVPGDIVAQGQVIGTKGSTGTSTGPHLHFEVHLGQFSWHGGTNPTNWINF